MQLSIVCFDGGEKVSSLCICAIHSDFNKKNLSQIYFSKIASSLTLFTGRVLRVRIKSNLNPLTPKISLVILLTICHTILVVLVQRIWY